MQMLAAELLFKLLADPVENQLGVLDFKVVADDGGRGRAWPILKRVRKRPMT
jgi:hypothetical protein